MRALLWLGWAAALANSFVAPTPRRAPLRKHSRDRARAFAAPDDDIDALEVRLDVTILWCHCLARELCRELTHNPPKAVPGFTRVTKDLPDGRSVEGVVPKGAQPGDHFHVPMPPAHALPAAAATCWACSLMQ